MNPTERQRFDLREKLNAVIGSENSETLMESLPPFDWTRIVTKDDLFAIDQKIDSLESRLSMKFDAMLSKALLGQYRTLIGTMVALHAATVGLLTWILR